MGVATMSNWTFNLLVALTFLVLVENLGPGYTFWLYAIVRIGSLVFSYYLVPETKGRTLEEIGNRSITEIGILALVRNGKAWYHPRKSGRCRPPTTTPNWDRAGKRYPLH